MILDKAVGCRRCGMTQARILVVEDDNGLREALVDTPAAWWL